MIIHNYYDVSVSRCGIRNDVVCNLRWAAQFKLDADTRELFPYINAAVSGVRYTVEPLCVRFDLNCVVVTLFPTEAMASPFTDRDHAYRFIEELVTFLNDLYEKRDEIEPNHKIAQKPLSVKEIVKLLPLTNCRKCGYATCMAFAAALSQGEIKPDRCPGFAAPISVNAVYPVLGRDGAVASTISIEIDEPKKQGKKPNGPTFVKSVEDYGSTIPEDALFDNHGIRISKKLTPREIQVLRLVADGSTNPEISEQMGISHHTVKSHVLHIFNKISANDRTQAAVWAVRNNVI